MSQIAFMRLPFFTVALAALLVTACSEPLTTEQIIVSKIRTIEAQIEEGERRRLLNNFAEDFKAQNGQMNKQQLHAFIVLQLTRYKNLNARLFPVNVQTTSESEATAIFKALVTGGAGLIPDDGQLYEFTTHWRQDEDEWLLIAANWKRASMGELLN